MTGWLSIEHAAEFLDATPSALRRRIERVAKKAPDGVMEASVDGLRARKLGGTWRIRLGQRWLLDGGQDER